MSHDWVALERDHKNKSVEHYHAAEARISARLDIIYQAHKNAAAAHDMAGRLASHRRHEYDAAAEAAIKASDVARNLEEFLPDNPGI